MGNSVREITIIITELCWVGVVTAEMIDGDIAKDTDDNVNKIVAQILGQMNSDFGDEVKIQNMFSSRDI